MMNRSSIHQCLSLINYENQSLLVKNCIDDMADLRVQILRQAILDEGVSASITAR
jgi:hypothetical protein